MLLGLIVRSLASKVWFVSTIVGKKLTRKGKLIQAVPQKWVYEIRFCRVCCDVILSVFSATYVIIVIVLKVLLNHKCQSTGLQLLRREVTSSKWTIDLSSVTLWLFSLNVSIILITIRLGLQSGCKSLVLCKTNAVSVQPIPLVFRCRPSAVSRRHVGCVCVC